MKRKLLTFTLLVLNLTLLCAQDFVVEGVTYSGGNYVRLQQLNAKIKIKNIGASSTTAFSVSEIYLSEDKILDKTKDSNCGFISFWGLAAGESKEMSIAGGANQFGINTKPGDYYVIFVTDTRNEVLETDENNNILIGNEMIHLTESNIDLTSNGWLIQSPNNLKFDDLFKVSIGLKNYGANTLNSVFYEYFLSTDNILDVNDQRLGYLYYAGFNWLNTKTLYDEITIPKTIYTGDYNVILKIGVRGQEIDIIDTNMNNNILTLGKVHIDGIPIFTSLFQNESNSELEVINPVTDFLEIRNLPYTKKIELYALSGELIIAELYSTPKDVTFLSPGMYILKVDSRTFKIIKK